MMICFSMAEPRNRRSARGTLQMMPALKNCILLLRENPAGLLYVRDELAGWITQMEKRTRDRAFFLETWDGNGEFTFDRAGRGTVHARNLCLSVFGGIQPARLQAYVADAVSGGVGDDGFV